MLDQQPMLPGPFHRMLHRGAGTLIGPAGQRAAEVAGKNRVRDFVRQHGVEDALLAALDRHRPVEHLAAVEHEARRAAGAEVLGDLRRDRAGAAPAGQRTAGPLDRERVAILLGGIADPPGQEFGRRVDDEVGGAMSGSPGGRCHHGPHGHRCPQAFHGATAPQVSTLHEPSTSVRADSSTNPGRAD